MLSRRHIALAAGIAGLRVVASHTPRSGSGVAYYDPHDGGGSMLDNAGYGYGEPLNVSRISLFCM